VGRPAGTAGTPKAVVDKVSEELARIVRSQDFSHRIVAMGGRPRSSTAAEFRNFVRVEVDRWRGSSRAPGPGWSDAMIALGFATLAQETRHQRVLDNGFSFHRSEWMQSGRGPGLSPPCSWWNSRRIRCSPALSHAQPVPGHPGRLRHTGTARRGSRVVHYAGAFTDTGPWWRGRRSELFHDTSRLRTGANFLPAARDSSGVDRTTCTRTCASSTADRSASRPGVGLPGPADRAAGRSRGLRPAASARALLAPEEPGGSGSSSSFSPERWPRHRARCGLESRYLSPGEDARGCAAGESGLHLLVLQMPRMRANTPMHEASPV